MRDDTERWAAQSRLLALQDRQLIENSRFFGVPLEEMDRQELYGVISELLRTLLEVHNRLTNEG